jgi:hypothetical protein
MGHVANLRPAPFIERLAKLSPANQGKLVTMFEQLLIVTEEVEAGKQFRQFGVDAEARCGEIVLIGTTLGRITHKS